jgi:hypothetical protein
MMILTVQDKSNITIKLFDVLMREKFLPTHRYTPSEIMSEAQALTNQLVSTYEQPESVKSTTTQQTERCNGCEKNCEITPDDYARFVLVVIYFITGCGRYCCGNRLWGVLWLACLLFVFMALNSLC